jgi:hypothetical protein
MTISIQVSVNGNYEAPVKVTRTDGSEENHTVNGRDAGSSPLYINHYHGDSTVTTVAVGPEKYVSDVD